MDQNLAWLTQKTEEPKSNKGNLTFPSHTVNMIELQSNKKWQPFPWFLHQRHFIGLSPLSSKKFSTLSKVTQFSEGPTPCLIRGGGGRGVPTKEMCSIKCGSSCLYYGSSVSNRTSFISTSKTILSIGQTNTWLKGNMHNSYFCVNPKNKVLHESSSLLFK